MAETYTSTVAADGAALDAALSAALSATQPGDLGTAAAEDVGAFATAEQGSKADSAIQPQSGTITKLGGADDYLQVGVDGSSKLIGAATQWDDLDFAVTIRNNPSDNPPVWTQISDTGVFGWAFQTGDIAHFQRQIPHAFKVGQTGWSPHVHWMPTTSAQYTGTWTLTLTGHVTNPNPAQAPLINTVTRTGSFNVSATAWQGHLTALNDGEAGKAIDGTGWGISTILFAKLVLTLSAGAACLLSGFDMHGEIDAFGSDQEYTK
jgi:hypothetical protein